MRMPAGTLPGLPWRGLGTSRARATLAPNYAWCGVDAQKHFLIYLELNAYILTCPVRLVFWYFELLPKKDTISNAPPPNPTPICHFLFVLFSALGCGACSGGRVMVGPSSFPALSPAPVSPDTSFPFSPPPEAPIPTGLA